MNTRLKFGLLIPLCVFSAAACKKNAGVPVKNTGVSIRTFTLGTAVLTDSVIDNPDSSKVLITVLYGTDLSALKPAIKISAGAIISPASGETVNFGLNRGKYTYTVTSGSGISRKWYIEITSFIPPPPDLSKYQPDAHPDSLFNGYFTRYSGWNSGDGAQSILLPGGSVFWLFGDSFIGNVSPQRTRVGNNVLVHNAAMLQQGGNFTSYFGGTAAAPTALFTPADPTHYYWTRHGFVDAGKLYVTLMELTNVTANGATSVVHVADKVAVISLTTFKEIKLINIPYNNGISYGDRSFVDGGYHYIFGTWSDGWATKLYMARAKVGAVEQPWEFYANNDSWVSDMAQAIPISIASHVTEPTVVNRNGRYYLFTQQNFFSKNILMYRADKPEGPYTNEITVYTEPDSISTYLAIGHPEFIQNQTLLIGYSLGGDIFQSYKDVDIERPRFIRVNLPE